jgi:hypothetical protein
MFTISLLDFIHLLSVFNQNHYVSKDDSTSVLSVGGKPCSSGHNGRVIKVKTSSTKVQNNSFHPPSVKVEVEPTSETLWL